MKKTITFSLLSFLVLTLPVLVLAKGPAIQAQPNAAQERVQDPTLHEDGVSPTGQANQAGQMANPEPRNEMAPAIKNQGVSQGSQSLNRVAERVNNPEVGQQIRTMVESHQQIQAKSETAIQNMSQRNQAIKLLIGPNYKNAGEVRSNIVKLRNDIAQLEKIKTDLSESESAEIQLAIDELKTEADSLDAQIEEQLSGFSLFGWLAKRFAN